MGMQVIELNCPGCGARVSTGQSECEYCGKPIIISSFSSVASMPLPMVNKYASSYRKTLEENPDNMAVNKSIAMCYLMLKQYERALPAFEKAMEDNFEDSEPFFYAAVCRLNGERPFRQRKDTVERILTDVNSAIMIEGRGIYYYFKAYVLYDYYFNKRLRASETYQDALANAKAAGVANADLDMLLKLDGVVAAPALQI